MKSSASSIFKPAAAAQRIRNLIFGEVCAEPVGNLKINKEERYSRVPRLSDSRYSLMGPNRMEICKQQSEIEMRHLPGKICKQQSEIECATYRR